MIGMDAVKKNVKFMVPGSGVFVLGWNFSVHIQNMGSLRNFLSTTGTVSSQTMYMIRMEKEAFTKIVKCMPSRSLVLVLGWGSFCNTVNHGANHWNYILYYHASCWNTKYLVLMMALLSQCRWSCVGWEFFFGGGVWVGVGGGVTGHPSAVWGSTRSVKCMNLQTKILLCAGGGGGQQKTEEVV